MPDSGLPCDTFDQIRHARLAEDTVEAGIEAVLCNVGTRETCRRRGFGEITEYQPPSSE